MYEILLRFNAYKNYHAFKDAITNPKNLTILGK